MYQGVHIWQQGGFFCRPCQSSSSFRDFPEMRIFLRWGWVLVFVRGVIWYQERCYCYNISQMNTCINKGWDAGPEAYPQKIWRHLWTALYSKCSISNESHLSLELMTKWVDGSSIVVLAIEQAIGSPASIIATGQARTQPPSGSTS